MSKEIQLRIKIFKIATIKIIQGKGNKEINKFDNKEFVLYFLLK